MSIYHYTTIKSLALILDSRKIRFTRLDLLDDLKEIDGIPDDFKTHFYVSCWTEDKEENLSLWSLYTGMKGIRIEFPKHFYNKYYIKNGDYGYWGYVMDVVTPLPLEKIRTDDYIIVNPFWLEDGFYVKVSYLDNYNELKLKSFTKTSEGVEIVKVNNLLRYKSSIWSFQNESRFYLMVNPLPSLQLFNGDRIEQMKNCRLTNLSNKYNFIDVDIENSVLDNIIVRLHPNCEIADKIIVESLLNKYTSNGKLEMSSLNGIYRNK